MSLRFPSFGERYYSTVTQSNGELCVCCCEFCVCQLVYRGKPGPVLVLNRLFIDHSRFLH